VIDTIKIIKKITVLFGLVLCGEMRISLMKSNNLATVDALPMLRHRVSCKEENKTL